MISVEERCRSLLDHALTLDRDGFVIALDVDVFCQAAELARALDLELRCWLDHVRWFYLTAELLRLLVPDTWHAEARLFAADCAARALQQLLAPPHPDAAAAIEVARGVAWGRQPPSALAPASQAALLAVASGRDARETLALQVAAYTVNRSVLVAVQGTSAGALWVAARDATRHRARAYAQEQRWQQVTLLASLQARLTQGG